MLAIGSLAFLNPWLLLALLALPALWYILRATPPAPARISFPGVRLLLGLEDPEKTPDRTPWWLLLLRMAIAAAAILAFADPGIIPKIYGEYELKELKRIPISQEYIDGSIGEM